MIQMKQLIPFSIEYKTETEFGMSSCSNPLFNKNSHIFASHGENSLCKHISTDQHLKPKTNVVLLLSCIGS